MQKWMWALAIGGVATYMVAKTKSSYTWLTAGVTAVVAYMLWKQG